MNLSDWISIAAIAISIFSLIVAFKELVFVKLTVNPKFRFNISRQWELEGISKCEFLYYLDIVNSSAIIGHIKYCGFAKIENRGKTYTPVSFGDNLCDIRFLLYSLKKYKPEVIEELKRKLDSKNGKIDDELYEIAPFDVIGYSIHIKDVNKFKEEKYKLVFIDTSDKIYFCDIINRKTIKRTKSTTKTKKVT